MQITLSSNEIKKAVLASLSTYINVENKNISVTFTSGRSKNDLTATVVITDQDDQEEAGLDAVLSAPESLTLVQGEPEDTPAAIEAQKDQLSAGDPVQEAEQHATPSTTGSLFKRPE